MPVKRTRGREERVEQINGGDKGNETPAKRGKGKGREGRADKWRRQERQSS